jgi:elongation factor G
MTVPSLDKVRNIGVVAHIDAGKTTVSERILYYTGVEHRMGEVHEGTAAMDWMEEERKRGITITAAATNVTWRGFSINLIDTPGHVDFTVEVERCMRVLDGAVLVLNGVAGLQAQSETVWRQMKRHRIPYVAFVNQYDRAGADYFRCVNALVDKLGEPAIAVQFPLGSERGFRSLVDLVGRKAWEFHEEDLGLLPVEIPIPDEVTDEVDVLRAELVEKLAEDDEELLGDVVEEREPPVGRLVAALRRRVVARTLIPVYCGAALRNVGVQPLLDAVVDYLPSPLDVPPVEGRVPVKDPGVAEEDLAVAARPPDPEAPLAALVFKLAADANEDLAFVRVYSGELTPGCHVYNPRTGKGARVARVLRMHADTRKALERAGPGEIVACSGLKAVATGDTLCAKDDPIVLERLTFPEAVITKVVEPESTADRDRLRAALERLAVEDPTFEVREDEDTGQWLIAGMGELHLEVMQHRLESDFRLAVKVGQPRVAYREAVRRTGRGASVVDRVLGGKDVYGAVEVEVRPNPDRIQVEVVWEPGCPIPAPFRPAVEEALRLGAMVGPRFGFPMVHARVAVVGGEPSGMRDSDVGYAQAANLALRDAMNDAGIDLLEPLMSFEITAPAEFMSGIIAELNACRADIQDVRVESDDRTVLGSVPLVHMFGYSTTLRSLSQGRASFSLQPAGFRPVPEEELEARGLVWG